MEETCRVEQHSRCHLLLCVADVALRCVALCCVVLRYAVLHDAVVFCHLLRCPPAMMLSSRLPFDCSDDMPAHVKSSLFGCSVTLPVTDGQLNLGTWQGIWLGVSAAQLPAHSTLYCWLCSQPFRLRLTGSAHTQRSRLTSLLSCMRCRCAGCVSRESGASQPRWQSQVRRDGSRLADRRTEAVNTRCFVLMILSNTQVRYFENIERAINTSVLVL